MKPNLVAAIAALLIGCLPASAQQTQTPSWMYVLTAGTMVYANGKLTLTHVDRSAMAFSERPFRVARRVPTAAFIRMWARDSKPSGRPNGSITMTIAGQLGTAAIELQHPRLGRKGLTFDVVVLSGVVPQSASNVSLFVDAFPTAINSQITDS